MTHQSTDQAILSPGSDPLHEKLVRFIFREEEGPPFTFLEILKFLAAVAIIKNRAFLDGFFKALAKKIEQSEGHPTLSEPKKDLILYHSLSYLAFSDPKEGAHIKIKGIDYSIEKIKLTSSWLSGSYYAYGLTSKSTPDAQPYLIFKGTTFPTDGGFLASLLADTTPHGAVGAQLYARGQKKLQDWINHQKNSTGKNIMCTGLSLGGAMSMHCHIHQPDKVDFFAIHPPSLTSREKRLNERHQAIDPTNRTLKVLRHEKDFVFYAGSQYLPSHTEIIKHGSKKDSAFFAHNLATDTNIDSAEPLPKKYNNGIKRTVLNILWKIIKPILFLMVLLCHVVAFPARLITTIVNTLAKPIGQKAPSSATEQNMSPPGGGSTALILDQTAHNKPCPHTTITPNVDESMKEVSRIPSPKD